MPRFIRLLAVILLWLLCWGVIRKMSPAATGGFVIGQADTPKAECKPVFRSETINPGQGLPMVHVVSLAQSSDGILHAVWYGGSGECRPDVKIYLSQKEPSGSWTAPRGIMSREQVEHDLRRPVLALGNALLIAEKDGSLRLLFVTIAMGKWSGSQLNSCVSQDGGLTWSRAERLTLSPFFNLAELVRNRPLPLEGGGWCVPVYQEFLGKFPELLWLDKDTSYRKSRIAGGCTSFQPSVVPLDGRKAIALMRDYTPARRIHLARTEDRGRSWTTPSPTTLPNPDAGISGLGLSDGSLLLAYNASPKDRSDLSLAVSRDHGNSWHKVTSLQQEEGASFSYPYLFRTEDGLIQLAYTWKGRELRMITFSESWLNGQTALVKP